MNGASMTMREKILAVLEKTPEGLTSRQLAEALHLPPHNVSSCASRLHSYGRLDREFVIETRTIEHEAILWRAKKKR